MEKYFRIVVYSPELDVTMILDAYGRYEKKWQFSAELLQFGVKILEISEIEETFDTNIEPLDKPIPHGFALRGYVKGQVTIEGNYDGMWVSVWDKHYMIKHNL